MGLDAAVHCGPPAPNVVTHPKSICLSGFSDYLKPASYAVYATASTTSGSFGISLPTLAADQSWPR